MFQYKEQSNYLLEFNLNQRIIYMDVFHNVICHFLQVQAGKGVRIFTRASQYQPNHYERGAQTSCQRLAI